VKRRYDDFIAAGGLLEDFSSNRKAHKKRSDSLGVDIVARLQELVDQDPSRSMRSLARELNISEFVVRKKMAQDIRYKSYALRRGQFMSQVTKEHEAGEGKAVAQQAEKPRSEWAVDLFLRREELLLGPKS
jgi:hypothetical protein